MGIKPGEKKVVWYENGVPERLWTQNTSCRKTYFIHGDCLPECWKSGTACGIGTGGLMMMAHSVGNQPYTETYQTDQLSVT